MSRSCKGACCTRSRAIPEPARSEAKRQRSAEVDGRSDEEGDSLMVMRRSHFSRLRIESVEQRYTLLLVLIILVGTGKGFCGSWVSSGAKH